MTGKENPESEIFELFDDNLLVAWTAVTGKEKPKSVFLRFLAMLVAWTAVTGKENPENANFELFGAIGCVDGYDR